MKTMQSYTAFLVVFAFAASSGMAQTDYTFTGNHNDQWSERLNWDPDDDYPKNGDTATIPNGKTCVISSEDADVDEVTVDAGGTLGLEGKTLTMNNPGLDLTVNGTLYMKKVGGNTPIIDIGSGLHIGGTGTIDASKPDYGPGLIEGGGLTSFTVNASVTLKGSLQIRDLALHNKGMLLVDHADDVMDIGVDSTFDVAVSENGTFKVTAGLLKFRNAHLTEFFVGRCLVEGGIMRFTDEVAFGANKANFTVAGGILDIEDFFISNGSLNFTSGKIKVAAGRVAVFESPL